MQLHLISRMLLCILVFLFFVNVSRSASAKNGKRVRFNENDEIAHIVDHSDDDHDPAVDAYDEPDVLSDGRVAAMIHRPYKQLATVRRLKGFLSFSIHDINDMTMKSDNEMNELANEGNTIAHAACTVIHEGATQIADIVRETQATLDETDDDIENVSAMWCVIMKLIPHIGSLEDTALYIEQNVLKLTAQHSDFGVDEIVTDYFEDVRKKLESMDKAIKNAKEIRNEYMTRNSVDDALNKGKDGVKESTIMQSDGEHRQENILASKACGLSCRIHLSPDLHDDDEQKFGLHGSFEESGLVDNALVKSRIRSYEHQLESPQQLKPAPAFPYTSVDVKQLKKKFQAE